MDYEVIKIDDNTWRVEDHHVRFFLLTGEKEALLIDSGAVLTNAKEIALSLTDLPIQLLNTHADRDHVNGNDAFETFYMHPAEASNYYNTQKKSGEFTPIEDGDVIDLGNRPLQIIALPGHTPGSIGVLDMNKKVLISGDPIQDGTIFMFGVQREWHAYLKSLKKLDAYRDRFDVIYPSHGSFPMKPEKIDALYDTMLDVVAGRYDAVEAEFHGMKVRQIVTPEAVFLMD